MALPPSMANLPPPRLTSGLSSSTVTPTVPGSDAVPSRSMAMTSMPLRVSSSRSFPCGRLLSSSTITLTLPLSPAAMLPPLRLSLSTSTPSRRPISSPSTSCQVSVPSRPSTVMVSLLPNTKLTMSSLPAVKCSAALSLSLPVSASSRSPRSLTTSDAVPPWPSSPPGVGPAPSLILMVWLALSRSPSPSVLISSKLTGTLPPLWSRLVPGTKVQLPSAWKVSSPWSSW